MVQELDRAALLEASTVPWAEGSLFHQGELDAQRRTGSAKEVAGFAPRLMRKFMPDTHREFYSMLPFIVVGHRSNGDLWATLLTGKPGFLRSPDPVTLEIEPDRPLDPGFHFEAGNQLGLLGIQMETRRRNRVNVTIAKDKSLVVDQSFGNCPQYISGRDVVHLESGAGSEEVEELTSLGPREVDLISKAETFFVASSGNPDEKTANHGVDVSHRGGKPGFVKVEGNVLTIPDFPGNKLYNTLGNFSVNPKAGLVFIDFATSRMLQLTGTAAVYWEDEADDNDAAHFASAQRYWTFTVDHGFWTAPLPLKFKDKTTDRVPMSTTLTGSWTDAAAKHRALRAASTPREFKVQHQEHGSVLTPADGEALLSFRPGQRLLVDGTPMHLASGPNDPFYRVLARLEEGQVEALLSPSDDTFALDTADETAPHAVIIFDDAHVAPVLSMLTHLVTESHRMRGARKFTALRVSSSEEEEHPWYADEMRRLQQSAYHPTAIRLLNLVGPLTKPILRTALPMDYYEFFITGDLSTAGVLRTGFAIPDSRIHLDSEE